MNPEILEWFETIAHSLAERVHQLGEESRTLAALRDALLPKLISGELRLPAALRDRAAQAGVKDAERFVQRQDAKTQGPKEDRR